MQHKLEPTWPMASLAMGGAELDLTSQLKTKM